EISPACSGESSARHSSTSAIRPSRRNASARRALPSSSAPAWRVARPNRCSFSESRQPGEAVLKGSRSSVRADSAAPARAGVAGALGLLLHLGLFLAERADALVGVGLDRLDERADVTGGAGGPLGELSDLLGDDREAPAVLAGAYRLDRGVQRQHVGPAG